MINLLYELITLRIRHPSIIFFNYIHADGLLLMTIIDYNNSPVQSYHESLPFLCRFRRSDEIFSIEIHIYWHYRVGNSVLECKFGI